MAETERRDAEWLRGCARRLEEVAAFLRSNSKPGKLELDAACDVDRAARVMREIAREVQFSAAPPIFTITGTIVEMGDIDAGRGLVIGKSSKPITLLGLSVDELRAMRMAFATEVTLTVRSEE